MLRDLTAEQAERAAVYPVPKTDPCSGWIRPYNDPFIGTLGSLIYGAPMYREIAIETRAFTTHAKLLALEGPAAYRTQQYRLLDGQVLRRDVEFTRQPEWKLHQWEETWTGKWRIFDSALDGYIELFEAMLPGFRHKLGQTVDKWDKQAAISSIERTNEILDLLRVLRLRDRVRRLENALDALTSAECERAIFSKLWHWGVNRELALTCADQVRKLLAERIDSALKAGA